MMACRAADLDDRADIGHGAVLGPAARAEPNGKIH